MNDTFTKLTDMLASLPSIGPRQARRLSFWLVRKDTSWITDFAHTIQDAKKHIQTCTQCMRLFPSGQRKDTLCAICGNDARNSEVLMLVERDVDLENVERTGAYSGTYFVLGGTTSPLDKTPERRIRIRNLLKRLRSKDNPVDEIIFALSATTEGEDTGLYLTDALKEVVTAKNIKTTQLGRGLSTGTELEYVDKDTMTHALKSRVSH